MFCHTGAASPDAQPEKRSSDLGIAMPGPSRTSPSSCIYIDVDPFSWPWFAGISRYTARLSLALAAHVPVRFFHGLQELLPPRRLSWSQDQDLADWGRRIWQGRRRPLGTPPADSIGLYCATRPSRRIFPFEVNILHDFCPMVVPWAFPDDTRDVHVTFLTEIIQASDVVLADSHSTKADAAWFSALDQERIVVASPGPSLCVDTHLHRRRVARSERIGLVVSTIEPRKNANFLFDWYQKTTLLPPDMDLCWVGKLGWMLSRAELERIANPAGGRRVRFLGNVSDAELCRLYRQAGWSIYPSRYEGFGFPVLDSLRHGTPVLSSCTSSMGEFDHPGIFFFNPQDPATVDLAWQQLQAAKPVTIPQAPLDDRYNWDRVARALLDARAWHGEQAAVGRQKRNEASTGIEQNARHRIGIELLGTRSASRNRGIERYSRSLVATLLDRDPSNDYVLYAREGLPTDHIPKAPNAVVRELRPDQAAGETTLAHVMERLAETNPDGLDVLLILNPLELAPGFDLPAKPLSGLKMVAVVYDLIPLLFQEEYLSQCPGPECVLRYAQGLSRLRSYDAMLAVTEATRRDCLSLLNLSPDRVVTIGIASDGRFFVPDRTEPMPAESRVLLQALAITRPFVFSVGSLECRKNLWGLIDAFAMLPVELRQTHQLVLTYALSAAERKRVRQYASDCGVTDQLVLTDWLSDKALRVLYQRCAAFVFPSSYEGFGLPILEAMHCGAPVIAGNNSSQIDVVGDAGLLVNVADAGDLAAQLILVLDDTARSLELRECAVAQARRFHWDDTAQKTLGVLTRSHAPKPTAHKRSDRKRAPRPRIAFFSPLPPLRSEVSDYSARLLRELKDRYTIDVYHDAGYLPHLGLQSLDLGCHDYQLFERNARILDYHALVYQMGSSPYHGYMHETMLRHPGIVAMHDLGVAEFPFGHTPRPGLSQREYHLNGCVFEHAAALIVHSTWCADQVRSRFPAHFGKTSVVAFGTTALDVSREERMLIRARFGLPAEALIIASLGQINAANMNAETVAAFAPLAHAIPEALLIFVGNEMDDGAARREATELNLQRRARFLGDQPGDVMFELAAIADIGICLRRSPTYGETPTALMALLGRGVPTIVSDVGSFSCFPDSVVRKQRWRSDGPTGLTQALRELADDRQGREALGHAALQYVRVKHDWTVAADSYEEIIEWNAMGRVRSRVDGPTVLPGGQPAQTPERFQAAS